MSKPEGWPETDPYPFRDTAKLLSDDNEDCDFVKNDKEYAKTVTMADFEGFDYAFVMKGAWSQINYLTRKLKKAENHIKWLDNVGGERLSVACGFDIAAREMVKQKREECKKKESEAQNGEDNSGTNKEVY